MRRKVQKNRNKQKQEEKNKKISTSRSIYTPDDAYMNITTVNLGKCAGIDLKLKLPFNFILRDGTHLSRHELTYLCRSSDLLVITLTDPAVDAELVSLIKRAMPTVVVVYDRKLRHIAAGVSKDFGSAKICEFAMLNLVLEKMQCTNTNLAAVRPFMIPRDVQYESGSIVVEGFMKNSLKSDKVIINGVYEGVIEEVVVDGEKIPGWQLVAEESTSVLTGSSADTATPAREVDEEVSLEDPSDDASTVIDEEVDLCEAADLITKYSEYGGIEDLNSHIPDNSSRPEHYNEVVFVKNMKYLHSQIRNRKCLVPRNKGVVLRIRTAEEVRGEVLVIFNLFEYETRKTIYNFDFSATEPLQKELIIDNGYRIFRASGVVTRNLNHKVFREETGLLGGVVSFIGPLTLYEDTATVLVDGLCTVRTVRLLNGRAQDRVLFECVELEGKPVKICKSYVVVKGMFYNKEQVEHFRNNRVESRNGVSGFVKKPLGTKGLFKAYFAQEVKHGESIRMALYKRIFL